MRYLADQTKAWTTYAPHRFFRVDTTRCGFARMRMVFIWTPSRIEIIATPITTSIADYSKQTGPNDSRTTDVDRTHCGACFSSAHQPCPVSVVPPGVGIIHESQPESGMPDPGQTPGDDTMAPTRDTVA
jgi:hypothetical protein